MEDRELVTYDQIPPVLIQAVIATEDKDFFEHEGVDPYGIARALYQDIRYGGTLQGGSTITQQYVKNSFLTPERTISRKVREATLSIKLEREVEKQEILLDYLNLIYFGRGAYGIGAASQAYFGKNPEELSLADSAYLAGLIRAPETADARDNPEEAKRRRSAVLRRMLEDGYITELEADRADKRTLDTIIPAVSRVGLGQVKGVGIRFGVLRRSRPSAARPDLSGWWPLHRRSARLHDAGPGTSSARPIRPSSTSCRPTIPTIRRRRSWPSTTPGGSWR